MIGTDPRAQLHHELRHLRAELQSDLSAVADLRAVGARREEIERLTNDLEHQLERLPRAAVVTLVGATGAGKSALLNALVGSSVATEGVDRPTTREPVVYAPHDADLTALLGAVTPPPVVVRYERAAAGPWTTQVLIDAPDLNSVAAEHRVTVTALAERSDVLVVVLHRQSVVEQASVSFVDAFAGRRRLIFVLNRSDELSDAARVDLLAQVRQLAAARWNAADAATFCVSARAAQGQPHAPGWAEFCDALRSAVRDSAVAGVRRLNALGTAARLERLFAQVRDEVAEDLHTLPHEAGSGVARLTQRVGEEVAARLRLRAADVSALLLAEAAKRWDGPGGWTLRTGGLGGLGLGAGALLARRSPIIAAGAAAGSLAADRMRNVVQRLRLIEADGLLPERAEFADWYVDALSSARVRASRLAGEPEGMGLPMPDDLRIETAGAVEESWNAFVERDLPAAAHGSVLRFLRVPLDLPVYGLGGWVVYRVARGFFTEQYTGTDFLVNALLLLAAYLLAVSVIVRRALAWRARRLLGHVIGRGRTAVAEPGEKLQRAVASAAAAKLEALQRLTSLSTTWRDRLGMQP